MLIEAARNDKREDGRGLRFTLAPKHTQQCTALRVRDGLTTVRRLRLCPGCDLRQLCCLHHIVKLWVDSLVTNRAQQG